MNMKTRHDVLIFWQEIHGELSDKWQRTFLKDPSLKQILLFPNEHIKVAIRRNRKLREILKDLQNQEVKQEEFLDKYDKYRNSRQVDTGSKIESREREGKRWGRTF